MPHSSDEPDPQHVQLYAHAVAAPGWTAESAAEALGFTSDEIRTAIEVLLEQRLMQPSGQDFVAVSPEVAIADRTHNDVEQIRKLTVEVERTRSELLLLDPVFAAARQSRHERDRGVEVLETPEAVSRVVYEAIAQCRMRAYIMHPRVTFRAEAHAASKAYDLELAERGVLRRNLYHENTVSNAATRRAVADLMPLGVQFRVLPLIPIHAIVYDDDLAIVSRRRSADDKAALLIRDPNLVGVIRHVFESVWEHATPFPTDEPDVRTEDGPTEVQLKILEGLAAGLTDESVARRHGIHVRTLRRQLTTLSEMMGTDSRFQLALRARERGWI